MSNQRSIVQPWQLLVVLEPANPLTRIRFQHPFNAPIRPTVSGPSDYTDREDTPEISRPSSPDVLDESGLLISLSRPPRDIAIGYVLGSSPDVCDAVIGLRKDGVSGRHLILRFDSQQRLFLLDTSRNNTGVSYSNQETISRGKGFRWILPVDHIIRVSISYGQISFYIRVARHHNHLSQYNACVGAFIQAVSSALPSEDSIFAHTSATVVPNSGAVLEQEGMNIGKKQPAAYLLGSNLNSGAFGSVRLVRDVSTWEQYVGKHIKADSMFITEVRTLRKLSHEHITKYIDLCTIGNGKIQLLIMEHCKFGSLDDFAFLGKPTSLEIGTLLHQGLLALEYLHHKKVVHRDIKPANILIKQVNPLVIALADFGLANASGRAYLKTFCGTPRYVAPEILINLKETGTHQYNNRVDIWSFGVVILEYSFGIDAKSNSTQRWDLLKYTQLISTQANTLAQENPDEISCALLSRMLQFDPDDRPAASECIDDAASILSAAVLLSNLPPTAMS